MNRIAGMIAAAAAFLAVGMPVASAHAQYGALAYDPDTRLWGRATNMVSPREAEGTALGYCRSGGCRVVVRTGPGECGAIAAARNGTRYHWSTRSSRGEAEFAAVNGCQQQASQACVLIVVQCNQ